MRKLIILPMALLILLCACEDIEATATPDPNSPVKVDITQLSTDKYTAKVKVVVQLDKPFKTITYDRFFVDKEPVTPADPVLKDGLAEYYVILRDDTAGGIMPINVKRHSVKIENIIIDGEVYRGLFGKEFPLEGDLRSKVYYMANPASVLGGQIFFDTIEICPHSVYLEISGKMSKDDKISIAFEDNKRMEINARVGSEAITITEGSNPKAYFKLRSDSELPYDKAVSIIVNETRYTMNR